GAHWFAQIQLYFLPERWLKGETRDFMFLKKTDGRTEAQTEASQPCPRVCISHQSCPIIEGVEPFAVQEMHVVAVVLPLQPSKQLLLRVVGYLATVKDIHRRNVALSRGVCPLEWLCECLFHLAEQ